MLAPVTDRFRHSDSGMSGDRATRPSCTTKYAQSAAEPHSAAIVSAEPQAWLDVCATA